MVCHLSLEINASQLIRNSQHRQFRFYCAGALLAPIEDVHLGETTRTPARFIEASHRNAKALLRKQVPEVAPHYFLVQFF
jgi:hypothetical protein